MNLTQAFKIAVKSIAAKKARSALTMLGVIIGLAAVIILVSYAEGQNRQMREYYESLGNNVVNIAASSLATILFTAYFGSAGAAISTVVMTILVLTFGEVLPKSYAKSHADKLALALGGILSRFTLLMTPFVLFFGLLSRAFTAKEETPSVTEDELKYIIDEIEEEGVLEEQESDLVISALQFDETSVSDILIPRVRMVALPSDATVEEAKQLFLNNHFSRFPVYEKDMDNIIGMITNKDFFRLMCGEFTELSEITQNVIYVPETKRISDILRDMQHAKTHLAIVVDQYGGTKGMVTLEDIIEQLVGEIYDESDEVIHEFQKTAPHTYTILGSFSISDVCSALDEEDAPAKVPETDCTTIGGWVMELLGHIPDAGETVEHDNFHFTVLEVENQTIQSIRLEITPPPAENGESK